MTGTPRNEWYGSSPDSEKYLKRGCAAASATTIGRISSATRPTRPSVVRMRTRPTLSGRNPIVAASTRPARSGSSRYTEQTSVSNRRRIKWTMLVSVTAGAPLCETSRLISSSDHSRDPSWSVTVSLGVTPHSEARTCPGEIGRTEGLQPELTRRQCTKGDKLVAVSEDGDIVVACVT